MTKMSSWKCTFTFTIETTIGTPPDGGVFTSPNICDREARNEGPVRDESLEPYGVIGDVLWGESELPPVDKLEPLPRLLLSAELVTDPADVSIHDCLGSGGGTSCAD